MEVGSHLGVCKNTPAESASPENGRQSSVVPILSRQGNSEALTNRGHGGCGGAFGVSLGETASIGDLGGNSKYSCENFED